MATHSAVADQRGLRHDISLAVKERIYQAAFVVLVVFFAFIIFQRRDQAPIFQTTSSPKNSSSSLVRSSHYTPGPRCHLFAEN